MRQGVLLFQQGGHIRRAIRSYDRRQETILRRMPSGFCARCRVRYGKRCLLIALGAGVASYLHSRNRLGSKSAWSTLVCWCGAAAHQRPCPLILHHHVAIDHAREPPRARARSALRGPASARHEDNVRRRANPPADLLHAIVCLNWARCWIITLRAQDYFRAAASISPDTLDETLVAC